MQIHAHKLQDCQFGHQWSEEVEDHWDYDNFLVSPKWREGWISFDCALYNPEDDRVYLGITSFASDIFKAFDRKSHSFVDLGYHLIANPYDAKFHRSLVRSNEGMIYAAIALLHDVDRFLEAPGSAVIRYDPRAGVLEKIGIPQPHVYIQSIVLDDKRETLYCLCLSPEKLLSFNLRTLECRDLGLISGGLCFAQGENLVLDDEGCVWCNWGLTRAWQGSPGVDAFRICKYDPVQDRITFFKQGLPHPDGSHGYAKVEAYFNFGDGFIYASGANGSLYRLDPATAKPTYLFTPTPDRPSRLSSLVKAEDGVAYGVTGRNGQCELMRVYYKEGKYEKLGPIQDGEGNALWQSHDIVMTSNGSFFICENDNPYRSSYLWEAIP